MPRRASATLASMHREVIAFPRRDRVVLGIVMDEDIGPGFLPRVTIVAEDGARFALPADQVVARFATLLADAPPGSPTELLATLRAGVEKPVAWSEAHRGLPEGAVLGFDDLALALGATDERSRLRVALALGAAEPWLRRTGASWTVVPRDEAKGRIAAADAARRAEKEDAAFRAWWPRRSSSLPPEGCAGALDALRDYALRGEIPRTERGRVLASHVELAEPDQVLEALVAGGLLAADTNPAPWRAALADEFDEAALAEARAVASVSAEGREDLTSLVAVAVDDPETTEVDDAISVRRTDAGVEILVHISDTAAIVPVGGALDAALRVRSTSLYVPDGAVTLLPGVLVEDRTSLDAGIVRAAVTGIFVVRADGSVASSRFVRSLVRVTRRMSYDATTDVATLAATPEDAQALVDAAAALRAARIRGGAVVTNLASLKIRAEDGVPHVERRHQDTPGDLVVAESAVLYNAEAGRLFAARDVAALFRVQDPPRGPAPREDDPLFPVLMRRRFAPTHLKVEPSRHCGVGHDAYVQATSPMRRYADLVNQRQLVAVIAGAPPPYRPADLETIAAHVSDRERAVRRASGQREDTWLARWIEKRGVRELDGVLARAPRRGLGGVWCDELLMELPLRAPDRWKAPPEGTRASWPIARVLAWRGRVELGPPTAAAPVPPPASP